MTCPINTDLIHECGHIVGIHYAEAGGGCSVRACPCDVSLKDLGCTCDRDYRVCATCKAGGAIQPGYTVPCPRCGSENRAGVHP